MAKPRRVPPACANPKDVEGGVRDGGRDPGVPLAVPIDRGLDGEGFRVSAAVMPRRHHPTVPRAEHDA